MKRVSLTNACCVLFFLHSSAQNIKFPPVEDQNTIIQNLFEVRAFDLNYHFSIKINDGDYLLFEFQKLGDWKGKEAFTHNLNISLPVVQQYADSFKNERLTRRLDVHIPEKDDPLISRFSQNMLNSNLQTFSSKEQAVLKMTLDTLRIVKKWPDRKFQGDMIEVQYQYTFLVKDIKTITSLINNKVWCDQTAAMIDSVVLSYRRKWRNEDAWFHQLYTQYDPAAQNDPKNRLMVQNDLITKNEERTRKVVFTKAGFGASLVRNTICPYTEVAIQFNIFADQEGTFFSRLSANAFVRFQEQAENKYKGYASSFVNVEIGYASNTANTRIKPFSFSAGFGYKLLNQKQSDRDPSMSTNMYRIFFNYGISERITLIPEAYTNFRAKDKYNGWNGITVLFRLF